MQFYDEIESFKTFLTFEMKREAMTFASYSDQELLFLWNSRNFSKEQLSSLKNI
jgi:hypothetical protein